MWILLILISAVAFSISTLLQKVLLSEEQSEPVSYAIVFQLLTAVVILMFALYRGFSFPDFRPYLLNLFLLILLYAAFNFFMFKAFQTTEASEVTILIASRTLWTVVLSLIFLHESIQIKAIVGILLVVLGVIVVSFSKKGHWKFHQGHLYALAAAFCFGAAFTNDGFMIKNFDVPSYEVFSFALPALFLLIIQPKVYKKINLFFQMKRVSKMLFTSIFYAIAAITVFLAYQMGGTMTQIAPLGQISTILTVILAFVFLKERDRIPQKALGTILVFGGVLLLV